MPIGKNVKKNICKKIFNSPPFKLTGHDWVDTDLEHVRNELQTRYPDIFNRIFTRKETILSGDHYAYENRYRLFPVRFEDIVYVDSTFSCLVRFLLTGQIKEFFVTQAYNTNVVRGGHPIAGRFLFRRNDHDTPLSATLEALAEEPAQISAGSLFGIHSFYARVRRGYSPSEYYDPKFQKHVNAPCIMYLNDLQLQYRK